MGQRRAFAGARIAGQEKHLLVIGVGAIPVPDRTHRGALIRV